MLLLITGALAQLSGYNVTFPHNYEDQLPELVASHTDNIRTLIAQLKATNEFRLYDSLYQNNDDFYLPIKSRCLKLSTLTGIPLRDIVALQYSYQMFAFKNMCTSLVAVGEDSETYHGRNLDYYWPQSLRKSAVKINYLNQNGQIEYSSLQLVGYLGINVAFKPGFFGVSLNERDVGNLTLNLLNLRKQNSLRSIALLQNLMRNRHVYQTALIRLINQPIMAPTYFILSGPNKGATLSRDPEGGSVSPLTGQYLVQGNLEVGVRDGKILAARQVFQSEGVSRTSVREVLGTAPVLNNLTICSVMFSLRDREITLW